jgi:hypothetical protein
MFVKFSCGCVGLIGVQGSQPVIIQPCDTQNDDDPLIMHPRTMGDKTYETLSEEDAAKLVKELGRLIADGYRFQRVRSLLRG